VLAVLLTACGTTGPTRFYTLAGPVAATATAPASQPARQRLLIEVLPVSVPERLARPQIVVRTDDARVDILEQDRWSAPLNNELRDALASGIANRLGAIDVTRSGVRPISRRTGLQWSCDNWMRFAMATCRPDFPGPLRVPMMPALPLAA